jgi:PHD/YefM family antitoxin component YafN of YafNO toxin-antitoxin module
MGVKPPIFRGAARGRTPPARRLVLITQHGLPAAYLIDVHMHEDMQRRLTLLEGVARGEKAILEKRVVSQKDAKLRMARWLA